MDRLLTIAGSSIELGLLYALMALGVYITFRILNFPDLTVDGSFVTGGAIATLMITNGYAPILATACAFVGGLLAGFCTGLLNTKGRINGLLAGILMMIALYSINLRIMGRPNISLLRIDTVFTNMASVTITMIIVVIVFKLLLDWFLYTDFGLALRATGDNERMIRSFGVNTHTTTIVGVGLANGLVALAGALVAQHQAFADSSMGVGMIVVGLASVIIGETLFGSRTVIVATLAVTLGAIVYRLIYALALQVKWLDSSDMKLITAIVVIFALTLPMLRNSFKQKAIARKRSEELEQLELSSTNGGSSSA